MRFQNYQTIISISKNRLAYKRFLCEQERSYGVNLCKSGVNSQPDVLQLQEVGELRNRILPAKTKIFAKEKSDLSRFHAIS
ncbi:hypothetical protein SAMN05444372_10852 [Flavobacterium micromati]|uniref:Uncharacterized protein n=1 Tax=Flavobacterium micromati TaxID=229205 RepID=A0A1M5LFM8_9FLAO|nr:hypothetical protein SAMN05444372_10852 [Flavobacterium micromati]